ncbi:MAG: DUF2769 domain-containing protein [Thermoplasmata archaeon]
MEVVFMEMGPEEMEQKKQMVLSMCTCRNCPSYLEGDEPIGYCFPTIGKSKRITEEKGCICADCPVYEKIELKNLYYCTRDSEKVQSGM